MTLRTCGGLRTGDIGLVRAPHGLLGYAAKAKGFTYEHAFLFFWNLNLPWVVEATMHGVDVSPMGKRVEFCDFVRPRAMPGDFWMEGGGDHAVRCALWRVGESYGFLTLLRLGWWELIGKYLAPVRALRAAAVVCHELVVDSWFQVGPDLLPGFDPTRFVPDVLWTSPAVWQLEFRDGLWQQRRGKEGG